MLTKVVYHSHLKKTENQPLGPKGWFSAIGDGIRVELLGASRRLE